MRLLAMVCHLLLLVLFIDHLNLPAQEALNNALFEIGQRLIFPRPLIVKME